MTALRAAAWCLLLALLLSLTFAAYEAARFFREAAALPAALTSELARARADLTTETIFAREALIDQIEGARADLRAQLRETNRQTAGTLATLNGAIAALPETLDAQLSGARADAVAQLATANQALTAVAASTAALEDTYRDLPANMRADREYQGLVAETLGVLGATKVTMGEAAKASKIIAAETPRLTANVDQISSDVTRDADSLTRPQSVWASIRAWFVALAKIYGAL